LKKGRFFEYIGVTNRLVLTRIGYHLALGVISIRDPRDSIQITDEKIQNVPIRLFKPTRNAKNGQMQPTIIFYHGGGFFVGSAGEFLNMFLNKIMKNVNLLFQIRYIRACYVSCC
jgi:hypothetical protein